MEKRMIKKGSKALVYKNGFMKKNRLRFFFVIMFATVFWSCEEEYRTEGRIVSASVSEITASTAVFTIELNEDAWLVVDTVGICFEYTIYNELRNTTVSRPRWSFDDNYNYNKNHRMPIQGFISGVTYFWKPFIQKEDIIIYGEMQQFTAE
jgi:hypothetical protein